MPRHGFGALRVRTVLFIIAASVSIYVVAVVAYAALVVVPAVARGHERAGAMAQEYDSLRVRTALLGDAYGEVQRLSARASLTDTDRDRIRALRVALTAAAAQATSVQTSTVLLSISPAMRIALAQAANAESRVAATLLEALEDLELGDLVEARRWADTARVARRSLIDRLEDAQLLGLFDTAERERLLEAHVRQVMRIAIWWAALGVALTVLTLLVLRRRLFQPLTLLDRGLARIASGQLEVSLPILRDDELGRLTAHFNEMSDVLRTRPEVEALRRSEERFRTAFMTGSDAYMIVERDTGLLIEVNDQFQVVYGYRRSEAVGRTTLELGLWADPGERDRFLTGLATRGYARNVEVAGRRKSGETFPAIGSARVLETDGEVLLLAAVRDLSEQRQAQEDLRRSEENYHDLVQHAPLGIYRSTPEGRFLTVNPALVQMLGYDSAEAVLALDLAKDVYANPEDRPLLIAQFGERNQHTAETDWKRQDGRLITVRVHARALRGGGGELEGFEALAEDVTEQHTLEDQFRQAQRLEAVGRLAGGVAHDFNNVLTVITSYTGLLLEGFDRRDPRYNDLEEIRSAAERATALTRQLLAFSRKQVLQTQVLNLNEVVRGLQKMLQRLIGEDVKLTSVPGAGLGAVRADPGQLEQVILNLAVNSRDAMPNGGLLTLETANVELDEAYSREHLDVSPGRYVMLAVSDTGLGMDPVTRSRIFEPFFTTKGPGKGTGLGLATVYGIIKQSGGHVLVYSEPGHGTTFKIYLPRVAEQTETSESADGDDEEVPGGSETILLAEDDSAVRGVVVSVLKQKGYRVLQATNGTAAIELARSHQGPVDLLITDLIMPGMTGRDLADALADHRPGTRILFMSGYTDDAVIRQRVLDEGTPFLQKPFTPRDLALKAREVLDATT
jgi:two-component system cell cycle sensor histidine kinase/response regulator CckA